jgi:hypothetical protein
MANQAEQLRDSPSQELQEFLTGAQEWSTASESTVRKDFPCDDGSVLSAMSHNGGEVYYEIAEPPPPNGATGV